MPRICYRNLKRYKYQLMEDYTIQIEINPASNIGNTDFIFLTPTGQLTIKKH